MRITRAVSVILATLLFLLAPWSGLATAEENTGETVTARLGPLGEAIKAAGALVPARHEDVKAKFEAWRGKLEIVEAAPDGPVVKGQTLLRLDDADYRKDLKARARAMELGRIGLDRKERLYALQEAAWELKKTEVLRSKRLADEALERFVGVERKLKEAEAEYVIAGRRNSIKNMREELDQLEKMYKEDDLTEETEEIVLKRNRRNMERMLESFERYKNRWAYSREVSLPREHEKLTLAARKAADSFARLQATAPLDRRKAELEIEKAREDAAKAEESFAKFKADGEAFTITAPIEGYAVRGTFAGGAWKTLGSDAAYEVGATVKAGQALYTVVDESVLRVHTAVKEADLAATLVGLGATVTTSLTGDAPLAAEVGQVARYGVGGSYKVVLRLTGKDERLRAGLRCKVQIMRAGGEEVVSIPQAAIAMDEGIAYVWQVLANGAVKTAVHLGAKVGDRVEIRSGLVAGQKLLAKPPAKK